MDQGAAPFSRGPLKPPILGRHVVTVQKIVDFIQSLGWDVDGLSIYRYEEIEGSPFEPRENWKQPKRHLWGLELKVAPREDEQPQRERERSEP